MVNQPNPVKDLDGAHPVAEAWRSTVRAIVKAIADGDYGLARPIPHVAPLEAVTARRIRSNISAYGERITHLPEEAWKSSVAQWMGTHWEVLIDLWTAESGRSDLVLHIDVFDQSSGYEFRVVSIYVP